MMHRKGMIAIMIAAQVGYSKLVFKDFSLFESTAETPNAVTTVYCILYYLD